MKYSVFTTILPELDLDETIETLREHGYDGVEWRCRRIPEGRENEPYSFWGNHKNDLTPERLRSEGSEIGRKCREAGLEPFSVASYVSCYEHDEIRLVAEGAAAVGAGCFRVGPPRYDGSIEYGTLLEQAIENYSEVVKIARSFGLAAAIETHMGNICCSASATSRIVSQFSPEEIKVVYDPGNMVKEGFEPYQMGLEILGPYLSHVHVKNYRWTPGERRPDGSLEWVSGNCPLLDGIVDWREVLRALRKIGFNGFLSMEDFSDTPWRKKLQDNKAFLRKLEEDLEQDD